MRLLLDTNVFLEVILEQNQAEIAKTLLSQCGEYDFFISDYSLHSIGLILFHRNQHGAFGEFIQDMIINAGVQPIALSAEELENVISAALRFNLDFDDAYQYAVAQRYRLTIISFDADFDRTERGRRTPQEVLS